MFIRTYCWTMPALILEMISYQYIVVHRRSYPSKNYPYTKPLQALKTSPKYPKRTFRRNFVVQRSKMPPTYARKHSKTGLPSISNSKTKFPTLKKSIIQMIPGILVLSRSRSRIADPKTRGRRSYAAGVFNYDKAYPDVYYYYYHCYYYYKPLPTKYKLLAP